MTVERAFHVENYVGTYEFISYEGTRFIASKERVNDPKQPLLKKQIFNNEQSGTRIIIELANVDTTNDASILSFCNKYGLPCSSQEILVQNPGYFVYGKEIDEHTFAEIIPFYQKDTMAYEEFCRYVLLAKNLLNIKECLDASPKISSDLIPPFLYVLLMSRKHLYDYDKNDSRPLYASMRFQYLFQRMCAEYDLGESLDTQIPPFLFRLKNLRKTNLSAATVRDFDSETWRRLIAILEQIFIKDKTQVRDMDGNGTLEFGSRIIFTGDINELFSLARLVLCEFVNEGCAQVTPRLAVDSNGEIYGDWFVPYQFNGLYLELFLMLASNGVMRRCADVSCRRFFKLEGERADKIYCSRSCALRVAKRKERQRKKELAQNPSQTSKS